MLTMCKNHPSHPATTRCKRCSTPLCNECKMITDVGVVCSYACLEAVKAFQDRVGSDVPRPRRSLRWARTLKGLFVVAVLFGIAYGILCFRAGRLLSALDVLGLLSTWIRTLRTVVF